MKCFKNGLMHLFELKSIWWIQKDEYWCLATKERVDFSVNIFLKILFSTSTRQVWIRICETWSEKASSSIEKFYGIYDINRSMWSRDRTIARYPPFKVVRKIQVRDSWKLLASVLATKLPEWSWYPLFRPFHSNIEYDRNIINYLAKQIPKKFEIKKVFKSARAIETFKKRHPMENGRIYFDKILHLNCFLFRKTKQTQVKVDKIEFEFPNMSLYEIMAQKMNVTLTEFGPFVATLLKPNDLLSITYWVMSHMTYTNENEWKKRTIVMLFYSDYQNVWRSPIAKSIIETTILLKVKIAKSVKISW